MKIILEEDLKTGDLIVSRSKVDVYNRGYAWRVTFIGLATTTVSLMEGDAHTLTGTNARVEVTFINEAPPEVRGLSHIFQRQDSAMTSKFIEEVRGYIYFFIMYIYINTNNNNTVYNYYRFL
jgi:hypothetical protein